MIGSPSSQCTCIGQARTTADHASAWRKRLSGWSPEAAYSVTDHVPLSDGIVRIENEPIGVRIGLCSGGVESPRKNRV